MKINTIITTKYVVDGFDIEFSSKEEVIFFVKQQKLKQLFDHFVETNDSVDYYEISSSDVSVFILENYNLINDIIFDGN